MNSAKIGVDESGKGDYFGPLVVAACYVGPEHLAELEGVKDSKKLTDDAVKRLSRVIQRTCPHTLVVIGNERYNRLYDEIRNLNKLLAWGHARAIEDLITRQPADLIVSDQFANPQELQRRLKSRRIEAVLESKVRAESDPAVAAASVLARAEFLRRLKMLSDRFEIPLPKGAGDQVIAPARRFVQKYGVESLGCVAKLHFATTKTVVGT